MAFTDLQFKIDLRYDAAFKAVFTKDTLQSRAALAGLLSAFLKRKITIDFVTANELPAANFRQRQIRYDISVIFDDGERANIEMMLYPVGSDKVRMEYYLARLFTGQDIKGAEKNFDGLKRTWQLSIAGNNRFFNDGEWFHQFSYYDPERNISFGGLTGILTVELDKLEKTLGKGVDEMSSLERWAVFIRYYTDETKRELLQNIREHEEAISMAAQVVKGLTQDEIAYLQEMSREKQETAYRDALHEARDEGRMEIIALLKSGKTLEEVEQFLGFNAN